MKRLLVLMLLSSSLNAALSQSNKLVTDRKLWLSYLDKLARPVLSNLSENRLKEKMPVVLSVRVDNKEARSQSSYLEAFGRVLAGIAPWLNLEGGNKEEISLRNQYREWTLKAIKNAVNPSAKDYLKWNGGQPLVDASFFCPGIGALPLALGTFRHSHKN